MNFSVEIILTDGAYDHVWGCTNLTKVEWIIEQKRKGLPTNKIAKTMKVSTIWIKKL